MKKYILSLIILSTVLISCDYWASHTYTVTNKSSCVVTVKTELINKYDFNTPDSVHVIRTGESKKIIDEQGSLCAKKEHPSSWYVVGDTVPLPQHKFDIYVNGILMPELRLFQYWNFRTSNALGIYELIITDELLDSIKYLDE